MGHTYVDGIREVTDEEVAFYRDHGWVNMSALISTELAERLLRRAKEVMGDDAGTHTAREGIDSATNPWQDRHNIVEDDALFASVGMHPQMGRNAQRLLRREIGVLLYNNLLAVKIGEQQTTSAPASGETGFHQDGAGYPMDRNGVATFWIALDDLSADMGTVQYVDRSHVLGSLGNMNRGGYIQGKLHDVYPELRTMTLTESPSLSAGDAAAHQMFTVHYAPPNRGDRPRWAFLVRYLAADTVYTGAISGSQATIRKIERAGLQPGDLFVGDEYPLVAT